MSDWIEHLKGLAKLEDNVGKRVAFETSAEEIQRLEAENAELRKQIPRWIPVSEGEPTEPGNYLVCDYDDEQTVMYHNGTKGFWEFDEVAMYMAYPKPTPPEREE